MNIRGGDKGDGMSQILALDIGFTGMGWVIARKQWSPKVRNESKGEKKFRRLSRNLEILAVGIIKTKPEAKKRGIPVPHDRARRSAFLFNGLRDLIRDWSVRYVVAEIPYGSGRSSHAVAGMALATAVVACVVETHNLPVEWYLEDEVKRVTTGKTGSTSISTLPGNSPFAPMRILATISSRLSLLKSLNSLCENRSSRVLTTATLILFLVSSSLSSKMNDFKLSPTTF